MSKVSMTVQQIRDLGLWDKVCDYLKLNPYALNEGLIDNDDVLEFDTEFKPLEKTKIISYSISLRPLGDYKGSVEVPEGATPEQIKVAIFDDCEFCYSYDN